MTTQQLQSSRVSVPESFPEMQDYFWEQGWTDGLPVVPPTEQAVRDMLSSIDADPQHSLGVMQPRNSRATLEKLAINAVMAGCKPEHFPVVVAGVRAAMRDGFNLAGTAATTGGAMQVMIVNGPVAQQVGIQADAGALGPGFRANAAIGRALRLIVRNVAGLTPGDMDKATLSSPGRYSFCFAENEARSPWEPLHVERGYAADSSTVTMAGILGVYRIMESTSGTGFGVLGTIVGNIEDRRDSQLLPAGHRGAGHPGSLPRACRRGCRLRTEQSRREGLRFSQCPAARRPAQGYCPLRQPHLAQLDR